MKTIEFNHGDNWLDRLLNAWPLCLDTDYTLSLFALAWDDKGLYCPPQGSLFYNGYLMGRITVPFGVWLHAKPLRDLRIQIGIGWKLNGRFGLTCRAQSDASAADGEHGPNFGQASGWARGPA